MLNILQNLLPLGIKVLKYFVDSCVRDKVTPVPGSVVYCDLWAMVEHSGIYIGEGQISNIVVDDLAESVVKRSDPASFSSKSVLGRNIYVSCDSRGAVGHPVVGHGAVAHLGERAFYGLVINNCHQFSTRCVNYAGQHRGESSIFDQLTQSLDTWEPTMAALKQAALKNLGASKWRLWAWDSEEDNAEPPAEPDWQAHKDYFRNLPLNAQNMERIRAELAASQAYEAEIADETIPEAIRTKLGGFGQSLAGIVRKYEEVKHFMAACQGAEFSYAELEAIGEDFAALATQMQKNAAIRDLVHKMGRNYISEEKKKQTRIPQASKSEVHGTHRSDDLMRILPSELLNLEDETLETLFYARLLEKNLLSYELSGVIFTQGEESEINKKRTGPVVACLDTSGSMQGEPLLKAKALLLAIFNILKQEDRSLHVLLFGSSGEIREFSADAQNDSVGLLKFLKKGFDGGTDFETPLKRALKIVATHEDYKKADILMISDGDCSLTAEFTNKLKAQKIVLNCSIYSVLCNGTRVEDSFSDEVVVL